MPSNSLKNLVAFTSRQVGATQCVSLQKHFHPFLVLDLQIILLQAQQYPLQALGSCSLWFFKDWFQWFMVCFHVDQVSAKDNHMCQNDRTRRQSLAIPFLFTHSMFQPGSVLVRHMQRAACSASALPQVQIGTCHTAM